MPPQVAQLLTRVLMRMRLASAGKWFYVAVLWLAGGYALGLLLARGLGLLPDIFTLPSLLLIPVGALLVAVIVHRRPSAEEAAREVDRSTGAKDLFLTATLLERSPGEYKPLVLQEVQAKAQTVQPAAVVPFNPWPRTGQALTWVGALALASLLLPQFDPFGRYERRQQELEKRQRLEESVKVTAARAAEIQKKQPEAENSREVDLAMEELKKSFAQMRPEDQKSNLQRLNEEQKEVGKMWEKSAEERLKDGMNPSSADQKFGSQQSEKSKTMEEDLRQGKTDSLQKEAQELKELAEKMAKESDPATREQMRKQLESRIGDMADTLSKTASNPALQEALSRAAQQLAACNNPELSKEAAEAMAKSMDLTSQELKALAQTMRDAKALESALKAIQAAKMANAAKALDGNACKNCSSLEDYAHQFSKMCEGGKGANGQPNPLGLPKLPGPKSANGGKAIGDGSTRAENPVDVGFKAEKSESAMTAGKMLMEWKNKGVSDSDAVKKDYAQRVQEIKRGVSEAILQEEIPPGYHDAIKKYFDKMDQPGGEKPAAGAPAEAAPEPAAAPVAAPKS
ncbi:MAG: hypothetical protein NTW19_23895 [Planctomycetota bacterium]|nr:hypothetical protein [Planctomycetota bacterium]